MGGVRKSASMSAWMVNFVREFGFEKGKFSFELEVSFKFSRVRAIIVGN